jgi:hypothetical protein
MMFIEAKHHIPSFLVSSLYLISKAYGHGVLSTELYLQILLGRSCEIYLTIALSTGTVRADSLDFQFCFV